MKIVNDQETAAQQVLTQTVGLRPAQQPGTDLHRIYPRSVEQVLISQPKRATLVFDIDGGQAPYSTNKVHIGVRPVAPGRVARTRQRLVAGFKYDSREREFGIRVRIRRDLALAAPGILGKGEACDEQQAN